MELKLQKQRVDMKDKPIVERFHFLDLAAHPLLFEGVELPIDLGRGVTMRLTDAEETETVHEYLGSNSRTRLKHDGDYVCFQVAEDWKDERENPLRIRAAMALLPDEIVFRSEIIQIGRVDGKMCVVRRAERADDFGARILQAHFAPVKLIPVHFDQNVYNRVRKLVEYPLDSDPYIRAFESAHNAVPHSEFQFVTYMSIVEGLIGADDERAPKRDNIATKIEYFYRYIWPTLELAQNIGPQRFKDGREIADLRGAWNDLYRVRNLVAHGGGNKLKAAALLKDAVNKTGTLSNIDRFEAIRLLDFGVKSLLYWHLERPEERAAFSRIV